MEGLKLAGPMLTVLRLSKNEDVRAFLADITGTTIIPETGALTKEQIIVLFTLIFDKDGELQDNATNPKNTMDGLKLAKPMLTALRADTGAQAGLKEILADQTLNFTSPLNQKAIDALFSLIFKGKDELQDNADDTKKTMEGLELAGPMLIALRADTKAQDALKLILNDQTLSFDGALKQNAIDALFSLIFKADGDLEKNAKKPQETMKFLRKVARLWDALAADPVLLKFLTEYSNMNSEEMRDWIMRQATMIGQGLDKGFTDYNAFIRVMKAWQHIWPDVCKQIGYRPHIDPNSGFGYKLRDGLLLLEYYSGDYTGIEIGPDNQDLADITVTLVKRNETSATEYATWQVMEQVISGERRVYRISDVLGYSDRQEGFKGSVKVKERIYAYKEQIPDYLSKKPLWIEENIYDVRTGAPIRVETPNVIIDYSKDYHDYYDVPRDERTPSFGFIRSVLPKGGEVRDRNGNLKEKFIIRDIDDKRGTFIMQVDIFAQQDGEDIMKGSRTEVYGLGTGVVLDQKNSDGTELVYTYRDMLLKIPLEVVEFGGTEDMVPQKELKLYDIEGLPSKGIVTTVIDQWGSIKKYDSQGLLQMQTDITVAGKTISHVYRNENSKEIGTVETNANGDISRIGIFRGYAPDKETGRYLSEVLTIDVSMSEWDEDAINDTVEKITKAKDRIALEDIDPNLDNAEFVSTRYYDRGNLVKLKIRSAAGKAHETIYYNGTKPAFRVKRNVEEDILEISIVRGYVYEDKITHDILSLEQAKKKLGEEYESKVYELAVTDVFYPDKAGWDKIMIGGKSASEVFAEQLQAKLKDNPDELEKSKFAIIDENDEIIREIPKELEPYLTTKKYYNKEFLRKMSVTNKTGIFDIIIYYDENTGKETGRIVFSKNGAIAEFGIYAGKDENGNAITLAIDPAKANMTEKEIKDLAKKIRQGKRIPIKQLAGMVILDDLVRDADVVTWRTYNYETLVEQIEESDAGISNTNPFYKNGRETGRLETDDNGNITGMGTAIGFDKKGNVYVAMINPRIIESLHPGFTEKIHDMLRQGVPIPADFGLPNQLKRLIKHEVYSNERLIHSTINKVTTSAIHNQDTGLEISRIERTGVPHYTIDEKTGLIKGNEYFTISKDGTIEYDGEIKSIGALYAIGKDGIAEVDIVGIKRAGLNRTQVNEILMRLLQGKKIDLRSMNIPDMARETQYFSDQYLVKVKARTESGDEIITEVKYRFKNAVGQLEEEHRVAHVNNYPRQNGKVDGYTETGDTKLEMTDQITGKQWTEIHNILGIVIEVMHEYDEGNVKLITKYDYNDDWSPDGSKRVIQVSGSDIPYKTKGTFIEYIDGYSLMEFVNERTGNTWQELINPIGETKARIEGVVEEGKFVPVSIQVFSYEGILGSLGKITAKNTYELKLGKGDNDELYYKKLSEYTKRTDQEKSYIKAIPVNTFGRIMPAVALTHDDLIDGKLFYLYVNKNTGQAYIELEGEEGRSRARINGKIKGGIFVPETIELPYYKGILQYLGIAVKSRVFKYEQMGDLKKDLEALEALWNMDVSNSQDLRELRRNGLIKYAYMLGKDGNLKHLDDLTINDLKNFSFSQNGFTLNLKNASMYKEVKLDDRFPYIFDIEHIIYDAKGWPAIKYTMEQQDNGSLKYAQASLSLPASFGKDGLPKSLLAGVSCEIKDGQDWAKIQNLEITSFAAATGKRYEGGEGKASILNVYLGKPSPRSEKTKDINGIDHILLDINTLTEKDRIDTLAFINGNQLDFEVVDKKLHFVIREDEKTLKSKGDLMVKIYALELKGNVYKLKLDDSGKPINTGYSLFSGKFLEVNGKKIPMAEHYKGSFNNNKPDMVPIETSATAVIDEKKVACRLWKNREKYFIEIVTNTSPNPGELVSTMHSADIKYNVVSIRRISGLSVADKVPDKIKELLPEDERHYWVRIYDFDSTDRVLDEELIPEIKVIFKPIDRKDTKPTTALLRKIESLEKIVLANKDKFTNTNASKEADSLGRIWIEREFTKGITLNYKYRVAIKRYAENSRSKDAQSERLLIVHKDGDYHMLWDVFFDEAKPIKEIVPISGLFTKFLKITAKTRNPKYDLTSDTLLRRAEKFTYHQENTQPFTEITNLMPPVVKEDFPKNITATSTISVDYYKLGDILGRSFITEVDPSVIFTDRWFKEKETGRPRPVHSYKMDKVKNILFEYTTVDLKGKPIWDKDAYRDIQLSSIINTYLSMYNVKEYDGIKVAIKKMAEQLGIEIDKETDMPIYSKEAPIFIDIVKEVPWIGITTEQGVIYQRSTLEQENPTLMVMMPNDPLGRDIMRISPRDTVWKGFDSLLSDAKDWQDITINKWWLDGVTRIVDTGKKTKQGNPIKIESTNPYGILPGRLVIHRKYNDFKKAIENRDYIGKIRVVREENSDKSVCFRPLEMLSIDEEAGLVRRYQIRQVDTEEQDRVEIAYVYMVKEGDLLITEILNKEGKSAISIYYRQLIRLTNGSLANLRYIPELRDKNISDIITLGYEAVHYNLNVPLQQPVFSLDATMPYNKVYDKARSWNSSLPLAKWLSIRYEKDKDGNQIEYHRVLEEHPQAPNLKLRVYVYKYVNGQLVSREQEWQVKDKDTLAQFTIIAILFLVIIAIYPFIVNRLVRKEPSPYKKPKRRGPPPDKSRPVINAFHKELRNVLSESDNKLFGFPQIATTEALLAFEDISKETEQLIRQGDTPQQIIDDEFANFMSWCDDAGLTPPVLLSNNIRAYVLYKGFVHIYPNNFSNTTPNMIFFLFYRSLKLLATDKEQDISRMLERETKFWAPLLKEEYNKEKKGVTKYSRMTFDDVDDHFAKEDFVKNYDKKKEEIKTAIAEKNRTVFKTYIDEVGPVTSPAWTRKLFGGIHIFSMTGIIIIGAILSSNLLLWSGIIGLVFALGRLPIILLNKKPVELAGLRTYRGWKSFIRGHIRFVVSIFAGASVALALTGLIGIPLLLSSPLLGPGFVSIAQTILFIPAGLSALQALLLIAAGRIPRWGPLKVISLKEEPIPFQSEKDGDRQMQRPKLTQQDKQERTRSIKFWSAVFIPKLIWNIIVFTFLTVPTVKIWLASVGMIAGFPVGSLLVIGALWAVFVLFFFVDTFSFFYFAQSIYSYYYGRRLGLGRVTSVKKMFAVLTGGIEPEDAPGYTTSDGTLGKAKGYFIEHMVQEGGLNAEEAWHIVWKHILEDLYEEDSITGSQKVKLMKGERVELDNPRGKERLFYFVNAMIMNMPDALDWDSMDSLTATITGSGSKKATLDQLNGDDTKELGVTKLTLQISRYKNDWLKLCSRMQDEFAMDINGNITNQEMFDYIEDLRVLSGIDKVDIPEHLKELKSRNSINTCSALEAAGKGKERTLRYCIEDWANMRFWAVYKNIRGLMRIREVFEVYALICFKEGSDKTKIRMRDMGEDDYEKFIERLVDKKYQALTSPREATDFEEYLDEYAKLHSVFIGSIDDTKRAPHFSSRYIERPYADNNWKNSDYVKRAYIYKAEKLKAGKPESQNVFIPHITGKRSLFFDSNSATSFEDAIKIPMALSEFHQDPGLKFVNFVENIFGKRYNWKGMAYGTGDRIWVTSIQRVLGRFRAMGFYGHAAIITTKILKQGGVIPPDYVSEDLMLAIKAWLKDAKGAHREYLQFGKARQVDFIQAVVPFMKFTSGAFEMAVGRQIYRLLRSKRFPWWSKMMLVFTLGFYFKKPAVTFLIPIYLTTILFLGASGFVAFPTITLFGLFGIIISQVITLATLYQLYIEKGGVKGILHFAKIYPSLVMQFVTFVPFYYAGSRQGLKGASEFISTGKEWFLEFGKRDGKGNAGGDFGSILTGITHGKDRKTKEIIYKVTPTTYNTLLASMVFIAIGALGIWLWQSPAILWSIFYIMSIFFWSATPFLSRTGSTPAEFGWKTWARLVFTKDPASFIRIYKEILKRDKEKEILSKVSLAKIFIMYPLMALYIGVLNVVVGVVVGTIAFLYKAIRKIFPKESKNLPAAIAVISKQDEAPATGAIEKASPSGLARAQMEQFKAFYDEDLTADQMNARRLEALIDKGLLKPSKFFWMEDEIKNSDMPSTIQSLLDGELNIYIYSAGAASRMMNTLVKYGLVTEEDSKKPEVLRKYRRWNTDIWALVELIYSKQSNLERLLAEKEYTLSKLSESDKEYEVIETDVSTLKILINIAKEYPQVPDYAQHITIGPRHIKALTDGIRLAAKEHGFDADKALSSLKLTLGVNAEILVDAQEDLKSNNFFGLNPENIVFVMNDFAPAYELKNGEFVLSDKSTNYNHGFNIVNANIPNSSYIYDVVQQKFVLQEAKAFDYLLSKGAKTTLIHRSNDLITMVPECALDLDMYAVYRDLNQNHGANVMVEVLNNFTGQKGGLLSGRTDIEGPLGFLIEGLATKTPKVEDALAKLGQQYKEQTDVDDIPYNRLYQYFDIAQAQANLEKSNNLMPMSIKDTVKEAGKKMPGYYSPEIPTGDQTILKGSKTAAVMRRNDFLIDNRILPTDKDYTSGDGTLIHDFKELKNLPAAIAVVGNQDKISVKTSSAGIVCILLVGPAAAGKNTTSEALKMSMEGFVQISTGEILRNEVVKGTELGQQANNYMASGELVPDEYIMDIVQSRITELLREGVKGFIFDGFPRTEMQARQLDRILEKLGLSVNSVIIHNASDEMLEYRRQKRIRRFKQENKTPRKEDVDEKAFQWRQNSYKHEILPGIINTFSNRPWLIRYIDADVSKDQVPSIIEPALKFALAHVMLVKEINSWDESTTGNQKIEAIETIARDHNLLAEDTLSLYHTVDPDWRSEAWETAVAAYQDDPIAANKKMAALTIRDFLDNTRQALYIGSKSDVSDLTKLSERIVPYWRLRWFYFNTAVDEIIPGARDIALGYIFECLEGNTGTGDVLWKNGEAILTEIMLSNNENIWKPALEKAFIYLADKDKHSAWENISESINIVKVEDNPDIAEIIVEFIADRSSSPRARIWLAKKAIPEMLARPISVQDKQRSIEIEDIRNNHIRTILDVFQQEPDSETRKALAYVLATSGDTKIKGDLLNQLKVNRENIIAPDEKQSKRFKALFGRRSDIIKILGALKYNNYPAELRDELVWTVFYKDDNRVPAEAKSRLEACSQVAAQALLDMNEIASRAPPAIELDVDLVEILNCTPDIRSVKEAIILSIETEGSVYALRLIIKKLKAAKGYKDDNDNEAISIIEHSTATHFDLLLNHMLLEGMDYELKDLREISSISAIDMLLETAIGEDIVFGKKTVINDQTGKEESLKTVTIDGTEYEFQEIIGDSHSNPLELYMDPLNKFEVMVKSGNDYSMMIEYIGNKLFALAGLPVPKMSIAIDNTGRAKAILEFLGNYTGNMRRLPSRYNDDIYIKSALLVSMMIGDKDRSPWNMMFMKLPLNITRSQIERISNSRIMHIDFGSSMFSKPTSGFKPFKGTFSEEPLEFIKSIRHEAVTSINPAYEKAVNDEVLMRELAMRLDTISDQQIDMIVSDAVELIDYRGGSKAKEHLKEWIEWSRLENRNGSWNRKPRINRQEPIILFEDIIEHIGNGGTFEGYLAGMLKHRRDDIVAKFKSSSAGSRDMVIDGANISKKWRDMITDGQLTRKAIDPKTQDEFEISLIMLEDSSIEYHARNLTKGEDIFEKVVEEKIPGSEFIREFNPFEGFAKKTKPKIPGKQPDLPDHNRECGFNCTNASIARSMLNRDPVFEFMVNGEMWKAYSKRIFADKRGHFVLIPDITKLRNKRGQLITETDMKAVIDISNRSKNISVLYNSLHAGASVNHIHFHLVYHRERFALEKTRFGQRDKVGSVGIYSSIDYGLKVIMLDGKDIEEVSTIAFNLINRLQQDSIPYNLMIVDGKIYIMPRNIKHEVVEEFPRSVGIREFYGKFVGYTKEDFDYITEEKILSAFKKMSLTEQEIAGLIAETSRGVKTFNAGTEQRILTEVDRYTMELRSKPNNFELLATLTVNLKSPDIEIRTVAAFVLVRNMLAKPEARLRSLAVIKEAEKNGLLIKTDELKDRIDLHCHTYYSDGWFTPSSIVYDAWKQGMKAVAVVDHNTFDGLYEALRAGEILGIEVFIGVEFDLYDDNLGLDNFHMIAYLPNEGSAEAFRSWFNASEGLTKLKTELEDLTDRYRAKNKAYIQEFNKKYASKFEIFSEDLLGYTTQMPNRYQLGKALLDKYGSERLGNNEFRVITGDYFPFDMAEMEGRDGLFAEEIIPLISDCGGVVILPHPGEKQHNKPPMYSEGKTEEVLNKYAEYVRGVEVYSSKHEDFDRFNKIVETLNNTNPIYRRNPLMVTIGSDAHDQSDILIGRGDTRKIAKGNLIVDIDSDKMLNDMNRSLVENQGQIKTSFSGSEVMTATETETIGEGLEQEATEEQPSTPRSSSSGTLIRENIAQLERDGKFNFDTGSDNIKVIMNNFKSLINSDADYTLARDVLIYVLEDSEADIYVREMAAYALRLFPDKHAYNALSKIDVSDNAIESTPEPDSLPLPIRGKTLAEVAEASIFELIVPSDEIKVNITYSDGLDDIIELQKSKEQLVFSGARIYLVNKEGEAYLNGMLQKLGLSDKDPSKYLVFNAVGKTEKQVRAEIMTELSKDKIALKNVRVYAKSQDDIDSWKDVLINRLIQIMDSENFEIVSDLSGIHAEYKQTADMVDMQA